MSQQQADWTAPPKTEPPSGPDKREWKVVEHHQGVVIVGVLNGVNVPVHKIATVEHRADADLIVSLHEQWREGLL